MNVAKESGVTSNEVEANNIDTKTKASLWLDTIRSGLNKANELFDLNMTVQFRYEEKINDVLVDSGNV